MDNTQPDKAPILDVHPLNTHKASQYHPASTLACCVLRRSIAAKPQESKTKTIELQREGLTTGAGPGR